MFGKRKNANPTPTWLDEKICELNDEWWEAWHRIEDCVDKIIIKNGVIDLYFEGADKKKAIEDAEKAKYNLLCAIGAYDDVNRQYNEALKEQGKRIVTVDYKPHTLTSHEIIEKHYERKIFKK